MLLEHRNLLIDIIPKLMPSRLAFEQLLDAIAQGAIVAEVPGGAAYKEAVGFIVGLADERRWIRRLTGQLALTFGNRAEFTIINDALDAEDLVPTTAEPVDEVLLAGDRPFVNRRPLRNALLRLMDPAGDRILLVDGEPKTGKTFSYYLLNHAAPRRGFTVHKIDMSKGPGPRELAEDIWGRLVGIVPSLFEQGLESAERWAEKLAHPIATEMLARGTPRILVFDSFPDVSLPPGTLSLISRLTNYADQELGGILRVVLVRFPGELAMEVDDVAARDQAQPFTPTDMVSTMMQIAKARNWGITESVLKDKIDEFERQEAQTLRDRFRFLRSLILQLATAKAAEGQP